MRSWPDSLRAGTRRRRTSDGAVQTGKLKPAGRDAYQGRVARHEGPSRDIKKRNHMVDVNVCQEGSFHARMRLKQLGLDTGLFGEGVSELARATPSASASASTTRS